MDRYVSPPILLSTAQAERQFQRADVVFYDVDASGASFVARVFIGAETDPSDFAPTRDDGYAGFFCIFGHGGCFGDEGHCAVPATRDAFDLGPPHGLTPQVKLVDITSRLRALSGDAIIITVLPISPSTQGPLLIDALHFSGLRLLSYA
jgi:hypothetical protein